jgi:hypothetical protein
MDLRQPMTAVLFSTSTKYGKLEELHVALVLEIRRSQNSRFPVLFRKLTRRQTRVSRSLGIGAS